MKILQKIKTMPFLLAILTLAGLVAPLLALFSVLSGNIVSTTTDLKYGAAENIFEIIFVVILSLPVSISAVSILRKRRKAIFYFILGWFLVCVSPICLSIVRSNFGVYLLELVFYLALGVLIGGYLILSKDVKYYFSYEVA